MSTFNTAASALTQYDRRGDLRMPWELRRAGGKVCVHRKGEDAPLHCYQGADAEEQAKKYLAALYANQPAGEKAMTDEILIEFGAAVKALGAGRLGGHVVTFTDADSPDLQGEFFTKATDYGIELPARLGVYYHHGYDETIGRRRLSRADVKADDVGLWFETQLDLADRYQAAIYRLAEAGKLGSSSGAGSHLVEKKAAGKALEILAWPLAEISLTPSPVEPGARVMALKAWVAEAPAFADLADIEAASPAGVPLSFSDHGKLVIATAERYEERVGERYDARVKAGRVFSRANVREMRAVLSALNGVRDGLTTLLAKAGEGEGVEETALLGTGAEGEAPAAVSTAEANALYGGFLLAQAQIAGLPAPTPVPTGG